MADEEKRKVAEKTITISFKVPEEVYKEFQLRVSEGERSTIIREALLEKLSKIPRPDRLYALEERVKNVEDSLSDMKRLLADMQLLTFEREKVNPHLFGIARSV